MPIQIEIKGNESDALQAFQRLANAQEQTIGKLKTGIRNLKHETKGMGSQTEETFGGVALGALSRYAAGVLSIGVAVGVVKRLFSELNAEKERAAEFNKAAETGLSGLALAAGGDAARMRGLVNEARRFYRHGGAASLGEAAGVVGTAARTGGNLDLNVLAGLYPAVSDIGGLAEGTAAFGLAMGPRAGTTSDILSRVLAATAGTPRDPGELLRGAAKVAPYMKGIGASPEELIAATAVLQETLGPQASRQMRSLGPEIEKLAPGLRGQGLTAALSDESAKRLGGGLKGTQGALYEALREMRPEMAELVARQGAGLTGDYTGRVVRSLEQVPELITERVRRQTGAARETGFTREGMLRSVYESMGNVTLTRAKDAGASGLTRMGMRFALWGGEQIGLDQPVAALNVATRDPGAWRRDPDQALLDFAKALDGVTKRLQDLHAGGGGRALIMRDDGE